MTVIRTLTIIRIGDVRETNATVTNTIKRTCYIKIASLNSRVILILDAINRARTNPR